MVEKVNLKYGLIAICLALLVLMQSFIADLMWGGIIAMIAYPLANMYQKKMSPTLSALAAIATITLVFVVPIGYLINTLSTELVQLTKYLIAANKTGIPAPTAIIYKLPFMADWAHSWWMTHLTKPGDVGKLVSIIASKNETGSLLGATVGMVASNVLHIVLALIAGIVMLMHAHKVSEHITRILAMVIHDHAEKLTTITVKAVRAVAFGIGSVALMEGIILGIAYAVAGAPYPVTLGLLTTYMAMIPGGAPLSFTSVAIMLLMTGKALQGICLLAWGSFELFMVDKFIRPKLIGNDVGLPFLAVLFGLLGGVSTLGPLGLFVGPILMAYFYYFFVKTE